MLMSCASFLLGCMSYLIIADAAGSLALASEVMSVWS